MTSLSRGVASAAVDLTLGRSVGSRPSTDRLYVDLLINLGGPTRQLAAGPAADVWLTIAAPE